MRVGSIPTAFANSTPWLRALGQPLALTGWGFLFGETMTKTVDSASDDRTRSMTEALRIQIVADSEEQHGRIEEAVHLIMATLIAAESKIGTAETQEALTAIFFATQPDFPVH